MKKRSGLQLYLAVVMITAGFYPWISHNLFGRPAHDAYEIAFFNDIKEKVKIEGEVANDPDIRDQAVYLLVEVNKLYPGNQSFDLSGRVLIKTDRYPEYYYGERIIVYGSLKSPLESFTVTLPKGDSEGEAERDSNFSYTDYLAKEGIYSVMYGPQIAVAGGGFDAWSVLFRFKHALRAKIEELFVEPAAGVIGGILIGTRSSVPDGVMDAFNRAGLTHILAISGYNITLLINIVALLAKSCGRRFRFILTVGVIVFFSALTGLSASVIRASLMGGLAVFALQNGRRSHAITVILLSGALMVIANTRILLSDISFQLSFLSTLGLIILMPHFEKLSGFLESQKKISVPGFIGDGLMVTVAAQIFTTPITLYYFGRFSLISFVTNVLFLPLIPLIMLASFLSLLSSFLLMPWTGLFVALTWLLMEILLKGVGISASLPFASLDIQNFSLAAMAVYYLILTLICLTLKTGRNPLAIFYRAR